jgi:nucleotide-binding universal stress UspA family protein
MYKRILVAVDGSKPSNLALKEAITLAKSQRAILRLLHVVDLSPMYLSGGAPYLIDDYEKTMRDAGRKQLTKWATLAKSANIKTDMKLVIATTQSVSDLINKEAKRWAASLIVIGTHGRRGFNHLLLGSVAERVIRLAKKPVLVVHGR